MKSILFLGVGVSEILVIVLTTVIIYSIIRWGKNSGKIRESALLRFGLILLIIGVVLITVSQTVDFYRYNNSVREVFKVKDAALFAGIGLATVGAVMSVFNLPKK